MKAQKQTQLYRALNHLEQECLQLSGALAMMEKQTRYHRAPLLAHCPAGCLCRQLDTQGNQIPGFGGASRLVLVWKADTNKRTYILQDVRM